MEIDEGLLAFWGKEEVDIGRVIHEHVFCEDSRAGGMLEQVEGLFQIRVAVGCVHPEAMAGDMNLGSVIEAGGQAVGRGVAGGGVGAPAAGVVPAVAFAGSVAMDGDEDDVLFAEGVAEAVNAVAALEEADVVVFRYQEFGVVALGLEGGDYAAGKKPVFGVFQEASIGAPLSLGVHSVAVVNQDFHSWFCA